MKGGKGLAILIGGAPKAAAGGEDDMEEAPPSSKGESSDAKSLFRKAAEALADGDNEGFAALMESAVKSCHEEY